MMRRLQAILCRLGFHSACEHVNGGQRERVLADPDRRYERTEGRLDQLEDVVMRVRRQMVTVEARRRRQQL